MKKVLIIAWREFMETVKTKAFLLGAVIFPLLMIALIFMTEKIMKAGAGERMELRTIAVIDDTGKDLMKDFVEGAKQHNADDPKRPIEFVKAEQPAEVHLGRTRGGHAPVDEGQAAGPVRLESHVHRGEVAVQQRAGELLARRDERRGVQGQSEHAVTDLARALYGRATRSALDHVLLVVFDLPYGAVRRHLLAGAQPPERLRGDLARALRAALA